MWDDTSLNFPFRRASYVGGKLTCEGNGEEAYWAMDDFKKPKSCPCNKAEFGYVGNDKCKFHAKLTFIIEACSLFGQVFKFTTTSENSVRGILAGIELIKNFTKGRIAGLPLMLTFNNLSTVTPTGQNTTVPVVGLCYRGGMIEMRQQCIELFEKDAEFENDIKLLEEAARVSGDAKLIESDDEEREIVEEYFPDHSEKGDFIDVQAKTVQPELKELEKEIESSEVKTEVKSEIETETEPEKETEVDEKTAAKIELFKRLQAENNPHKAIALANRNDKSYLIEYFKVYCPDRMPDEKEKKPVFIEAFKEFVNTDEWDKVVGRSSKETPEKPIETEKSSLDESVVDEKKAEVTDENLATDPLVIALSKTDNREEIIRLIEERFPNKPQNRTLPPSGLIDQAKRWLLLEGKEIRTDIPKSYKSEPEQPEKEAVGNVSTDTATDDVDPGYFAVEGDPQVSRETIQKIVELKKQIRDLDDKDEWFALVEKFKDTSGNPVASAKVLAQKQGEFLVILLNMKIDGIPF